MQCDDCKERDSVVQLVQAVDGTLKELHLCEQCAAKRGVESTVAASPPLGEMLQKVQAQTGHGRRIGGRQRADAVRCTFCSATFADFRATGRLGCAQCYGAFESSLRESVAPGARQWTSHRPEVRAPRPDALQKARDAGRAPRPAPPGRSRGNSFELAADIRDRIRVLE